MPIAFLTGGTGFVGGHAARGLVAHGWRVRALSRGPGRSTSRLLGGLAVEEVAGDLSDPDRLAPALSGVDAIVHVAGLVKARTLEEYREVNVRGTERLLAAAAKSAPQALFLLVSSQAAAGPAENGRPVREGDAARPVSWYGLSKREAEESVARLWHGPRIVLRPSVVYGPGDRALLVYFRMAARGWVLVPAGRTRIQLVGAEQVGLAIARAASRRDLSGSTGFLCDPLPVSVGEFAAMIARLPRKAARLVGVPGPIVRMIGYAETALEAVTRRSWPFNADKAKEILAGDWLCDAAPLARALDLPAGAPIEQGLRAAWDWYRQAGWLPRMAL